MFNYIGTPIVLNFEVRNTSDQLTTADSVTFQWRTMLNGPIHEDIVPELTDTGTYRVIFTPDVGGTVFWKFTSDTPDVVSNGRVYIEPGDMDEFVSTSQWV